MKQQRCIRSDVRNMRRGRKKMRAEEGGLEGIQGAHKQLLLGNRSKRELKKEGRHEERMLLYQRKQNGLRGCPLPDTGADDNRS